MNLDELMQLPRIGAISWENQFRFPKDKEVLHVSERGDHWDRIFIINGKPVKRFFDVNGETHYKPLFLFDNEIEGYKYAFFIEDRDRIDSLRKFNDEKWAKICPWLVR